MCPQDTTSFDRRSTSFRAEREHHFSLARTQINEVALRANGSTPNDGNRFSLADDENRKILSENLKKILLGDVKEY